MEWRAAGEREGGQKERKRKEKRDRGGEKRERWSCEGKVKTWAL